MSDSQPGTGVRRLHPAVRIVWWVEAALLIAAPVLAAVVANVVLDLPGLLRALTLLVALALVVVAVVVPPLRYRAWAYELRDDDLWIRSGLLWRTVTVIPYIRLQFVDTKQGPVERMLGLSQLVVHTAAVGTSGALPGLVTDDANALRERLAQLEGDTGGL